MTLGTIFFIHIIITQYNTRLQIDLRWTINRTLCGCGRAVIRDRRVGGRNSDGRNQITKRKLFLLGVRGEALQFGRKISRGSIRLRVARPARRTALESTLVATASASKNSARRATDATPPMVSSCAAFHPISVSASANSIALASNCA